jgi:DNA-binding response OmpR family regulator
MERSEHVNGRRSILVVDDDASIRTMVKIVLERAGYEVTTARNGCEAIRCLAERDYDVVLLDVMMPKLDGLAVVDLLRKDNSPVLAHTYLLTAGQTAHLSDLPVRGLIGKPFDIETLLAETKDCIGH